MARNRTRREKEKQERLRKTVLLGGGLLLSAYLVFSLVFGDLGLVRYFTLDKEYRNVKEDIRRLEKENGRLRQQVEALKTDPETIEKLAREKLGMVREGEKVYQFSNP